MKRVIKNSITILFCIALTIMLYFISKQNYLLYHSLAEIFSVIVALGIFVIVINSGEFIENNYLIILAIGFLFTGFIDFLHLLAYKGMGVFQNAPNLPTQLWISARYIQGVTLLIAPLITGRKLMLRKFFLGYGLATALILLSIFYWKIFPDAFIEGKGLTTFKIVSEYIISSSMAMSIFFLNKKRKAFEPHVFRLLIASILVTIISELSFTLYIDVYGFFNFTGHILKIIAFYLAYLAVIKTGLSEPYTLLLRNLKKKGEEVEKNASDLKRKTLELEKYNKNLSEARAATMNILEDAKEANEKLKELDTLKTDFLNITSHELKTPLTPIVSYLDLLKDESFGKLNDQQRSALNVISKNIISLKRLIDDVLSIVKLEAGKMKFVIESLRFERIVNEIVKELKPSIKEKGISISTSIQKTPLIMGDKQRLSEVIINLLDNAIKFSGKKSKITIMLKPQKNNILFTIKDQGAGISKTDMPKLFTKFFQADTSATRKNPGTGLGLAVCKGIIESHDGKIWAESQLGKGSTFYFTLPLKQPKAKSEKEQSI